MIKDLEKASGIDMSYCSLNARFTTPFDFICTEDMTNYLQALDCGDESCTIRILKILRDGTIADLRKPMETIHNGAKIHAILSFVLCVSW